MKKIITCVIAGLVVGAFTFRQSISWFREWVPLRIISMIPFLCLAAAVIYAFIWQARKTNRPATLAFWQGLIRYGVAFDLASFGWEKICHLQLVMPASKLDLPYRDFSPADLFWYFFSHSYLFACIIAGLQITGAMLLLFRRTRLVGVFVLLPVLANILLMDIFYQIGDSVVVHASIMMLGLLYFLFIEFNRLKEFFFAAKDQLPALNLSRYFKWAIRLSVIYLPLLFIALHGKVDKHPELTGKYEVQHQQLNCADSVLTTVYFDVKNGCVFEFNAPERRWNGTYTLDSDHLEIRWRSPVDKPIFKGVISPADGSGRLVLTGMLGADSVRLVTQRVRFL